MDGRLQQWFDEASRLLLLNSVAGDLVDRAHLFFLVAVRMGGFFCIGPLLGQAVVSWRVRLGLVVLLTMVVAPGLPLGTHRVSPIIQTSNEVRVNTPSIDATAHQNGNPNMDILFGVVREAVIGVTLGAAIVVFLIGLKLAGEWLDRHSGLGIGSVMNPEYSAGGSSSTELLTALCLVVMLVMQPVNGHLLAVRLFLDLFVAIPPGLGTMPFSILDLTHKMLRQAMVLGLRIAMPLVVVMSLLDMTLGFVRRTSRWELTPAAYALRTVAALVLLAATLPGIPETIASAVRDSVEAVSNSITGERQ